MNKILINEPVAKFALWRLEDIKDYMGHRWDEEDEQNLVALRQALEQPAPAQACDHDWKYIGSKRQAMWECTKCGMYKVPDEQPAPEQEQEPVAYRCRLESGSYTYCNTSQFFDNAEPLYTTPPAPAPAQPLTERQRWDMYQSGEDMPTTMASVYMRGVQDAEAAHGITKGGAA